MSFCTHTHTHTHTQRSDILPTKKVKTLILRLMQWLLPQELETTKKKIRKLNSKKEGKEGMKKRKERDREREGGSTFSLGNV